IVTHTRALQFEPEVPLPWTRCAGLAPAAAGWAPPRGSAFRSGSGGRLRLRPPPLTSASGSALHFPTPVLELDLLLY
ncbi:MAG: hypothetical protein ABSE84_19120, partial [Isosphaeraceae bacterium]